MYHIAHRINSIKELRSLDEKYGIEIDIRDKNKNQSLYMILLKMELI